MTKTVIVTGASSGIGLGVAAAYLKKGFNVVGNARTRERLQKASDTLGNPSNFLLVAGDIALKSTAEEIVQQVFYKIWEKASQLNINPPVAAYLYRAVNNESINYLKHQKVKSVHRAHTLYHMKNQADSAAKKVLAGELEKKLRKALCELPEQCRIIFQLSRFEELRYREIAGRLGISVKTVENQMGKALKLLRVKLVDFLPLLILLLLNI
jgi:RNA polymerase sigma-70 factor (ECF subfamily)